MPRSPKVLSIVWNLIRGGTEGQCARLALELTRAGDSHRVAVFRREGFFLPEVERACGPVYHLDIRHMVRPQTLIAVRDFARHLFRERVDILHAWDCDAAIFGAVAAMAARIPLITSRRDMGQIYPAHKLWLMKRADAQAAAVVVNAAAIAAAAEQAGVPPAKITRVTNMIDLEEFDAQAAVVAPGLPGLPAAPLVGMVTRLDPEKDVGTFLRAAARIALQRADVSFVIAGDGVERPRLEQLSRELGIASRVAFLGDVKQVPALLRQFDVGVLVPSRNEGLSNTILEYMAAGLPVVATDCGGNRELVEDGASGFVVPVGDHQAVADRILQLLAVPDRGHAMGKCGRQSVAEKNQPAQVADAFRRLYDSVLGLNAR